MSTYEFTLWLSYYELQKDNHDKEQRIAKMKNGR